MLEPNGNFYMEGIKSMSDDAQRAESDAGDQGSGCRGEGVEGDAGGEGVVRVSELASQRVS